MLPFMYHVPREVAGTMKDIFVVKIACSFDYVGEDVRWMDDPKMGTFVYVPNLDVEETHHEFATEAEAINFIKEWWKKQ